MTEKRKGLMHQARNNERNANMKTLTLSTYDDRRKAERSALSEAVRRAMKRAATCRLADKPRCDPALQCRDALHSI
jgi:hypothetical protein